MRVGEVETGVPLPPQKRVMKDKEDGDCFDEEHYYFSIAQSQMEIMRGQYAKAYVLLADALGHDPALCWKDFNLVKLAEEAAKFLKARS